MASSSSDQYLEDSTTRVLDDKVLEGPTNSRIVIVPAGYKQTPIAQPTPREFLAYCDNGWKQLNQYALPVAYHNGVWHWIVPQSTEFYWKEPRPSISTFDTYNFEEVLKEIKEPSPVDKEFPSFEEPEKELTNHSDDESEDKEAVQIRHSPIVTSPPLYTLLPATTMASTSATTQTQTMAAAMVSQAMPAPSTLNYIASVFYQCFTPLGAPSGGGGGGGGGREQPQQPQ